MNFETPLCEIAYKYGTDKCPHMGHSYTPIYYNLFKDKRNEFKKVVELGVGVQAEMAHCTHYVTGASLYMWRDFFPNAQVYGADVSPEAMVEGDRIKTFLCDERLVGDLKSLIDKTGGDIDLFVDDALHHCSQQLFTCLNILPLLNKDVVYIIEDVGSPQRVYRNMKRRGYECELLTHRFSWLVLIHNKQ